MIFQCGLHDRAISAWLTNKGTQVPSSNVCCQPIFGYTKLECTVRYLGIEVEDALELSEQTEI
jgi:hypothetical protein